jgi:hypothetical protein
MEPAMQQKVLVGIWVRALPVVAALTAAGACSNDDAAVVTPVASGGAGASMGSAGSAGSTSAGNGSGARTGVGGGPMLAGGATGLSGGSAGTAPTDAGFEACSGSQYMQTEGASPLDIYFIFDRTASMGTDCAYVHGTTPPVASKACFATYALSDYLINENPMVDTRLAFQFMSLSNTDCDGTLYATPLIPLTQLPVVETDPLITTISNETFKGGFGTHIEGALRGMAQFTTASATAGREMIGVLMTDGDPSGCVEDIPTLSTIISDHLMNDQIKTYVIGMTGGTDANLEQYAIAGGADPHSDFCGSVAAPCHYWNVGDGSANAVISALQGIVKQAVPLPCDYPVSGITPPDGQTVNFANVNVTLTDQSNVATTIGQVDTVADCPTDKPAWYYDDPAQPTKISLCKNACDLVTASTMGSSVSVVIGCTPTVKIPK